MTERLTARQRLAEEIEHLTEDEVAEVLEYISIMKSMREEERDPQRFKRELMVLLSQPEDGVGTPSSSEKPPTASAKRVHRFSD
jgi:hypothetical protein